MWGARGALREIGHLHEIRYVTTAQPDRSSSRTVGREGYFLAVGRELGIHFDPRRRGEGCPLNRKLVDRLAGAA